MQLIPIRRKYVYQSMRRLDSDLGRVYSIDNHVLPSVTSILSDTKDKTELNAWAARVGQEEANRIKQDAATVGTHMHSVVERLLLNRDLSVPRSWLAVRGYAMGYRLIEHFFPRMQEVWGSEVPLYYPGKYAGTCDCVGVFDNNPSIIDFKQTNKPKQRKWIDDYFLQLAAYALAHDKIHGSKIDHGVIMMISQGMEIQEFVTCGREFDEYKDRWLHRVEAYEAKKSGSIADPENISQPKETTGKQS